MSGRPRLAALAAALLTLLAVAALSPASAAQLPLSARMLGAFVLERCTSTPLPATPGAVSGGASTQVVLSSIPAACRGKQTSLRLFTASGAALAPTDTVTTLPAGAATATITVPSYPVAQASGLALTVATWGVPTTWTSAAVPLPAFSCTVPGSPSVTCAATVTLGTEWGYPTATDFLRSVSVTTTSATPVPWQVTINLSDPGFPFLARTLTDGQGGLVLVSTSGCAASPRTVTVRGTTAWGGYDQVSAATPRGFEVHGYAATQASAGLISCP
ncbi:hypothetical protein [Cellulomonas xylanilytica]|uniref:Ig-like domain-containing protein n=1 Tax=Cellulomonas xylanilytica TaxID=233583 RepID=A0A510V908_9CELL|nr:hypothetical protein [Cellulomonas xylanilytica]GEK23333.1 hypothetical protein CXY01_38530 [Cellulomonas xylanilytica]